MEKQAYRAHEGMNWSRLKHLLESPRTYVHYKDNPPQPSTAMQYGTALHTRLLEPETWAQTVHVVPPEYVTAGGAVSTAAAARKYFESLTSGLVLITPSQYDDLLTSIAQLPEAWQEVGKAVPHRERPMLWFERDFGIECKGLPDAYGAEILLDVKTWAPRGRFTPEAFMREAVSRRYLGQLGFYARGLAANGVQIKRWMFLVCQSTAPHESFVVELEENAIEYGEKEAAEALAA